jgi:hypothetical protein
VACVKRLVGNGSLRSAEAVNQAMDAGLAALDDDGYGDVYDTVVRDHIYAALESSMRRAGMDPDALDLGYRATLTSPCCIGRSEQDGNSAGCALDLVGVLAAVA